MPEGPEPAYRLQVAGPAAQAIADELPEAVSGAIVEFITGDLLRAPRRAGKPLRRELEGRWAARRGSYLVPYTIAGDAELAADRSRAADESGLPGWLVTPGLEEFGASGPPSSRWCSGRENHAGGGRREAAWFVPSGRPRTLIRPAISSDGLTSGASGARRSPARLRRFAARQNPVNRLAVH